MSGPGRLGPGAVFAHRGNRVAERENTVTAFRSAAAVGAAGVEFDVRRTADRNLVVHHDSVIDGVGAICELDLGALRRVAPWVPTLTEAVDACAGMWMNIEIKNNPDDLDWDSDRGAVALLTSAIVDAESVIVSSFDWETVAMTNALGWTSAYLVASGLEAAIDLAAQAGMYAVNPNEALVDPGLVATAHQAGLGVMAWTVNDVDRALQLRNMGTDVVFTDDPARMVAALS